MSNSWSHRFVRPALRPMVGTWVRPDHITYLRVATGAAACLAFAWSSRAQPWGGAVWVISILLDNADGEFARLSNQVSAAGQRLDFVTDLLVNCAMFVALGVGLRDAAFGGWYVALGVLCGICFGLCSYWCEELETKVEPGAIVLSGAAGFDPDDLFFLIAPAAWFSLVPVILVSGGLVLPVIAIAVGIRLWRARRRSHGVSTVTPAAAAPPSDARVQRPQENRSRSMADR